jgi:hypothetical protein
MPALPRSSKQNPTKPHLSMTEATSSSKKHILFQANRLSSVEVQNSAKCRLSKLAQLWNRLTRKIGESPPTPSQALPITNGLIGNRTRFFLPSQVPKGRAKICKNHRNWMSPLQRICL